MVPVGSQLQTAAPARCCMAQTTGEVNKRAQVVAQDPHRQQTVDWCDATGGTAAAFDFTTKVCTTA